MRLLTCLGIGAGAMYFLDPQLGRRRRALVRDKFYRLVNEIEGACDVLSRDFNNRVHGYQASLKSGLHSEPVSDEVLHERVRAKLGRVTSHPGAIEVEVHDGAVTLRGPILAREIEQTVHAVECVSGVQRVHNQCDVHQKADISALQGGRPRPGTRPDILQENWSPTTRALVGGAGGALLFYGSMRRAPLACMLGATGLVLLARSVNNVSGPQFYQSMRGEASSGSRARQVQRKERSPQEPSSRRQDGGIVPPTAQVSASSGPLKSQTE